MQVQRKSGSAVNGNAALSSLHLDELLGMIIDVMPQEVELCTKLLEALRVSGRLNKLYLDKEVGDINKALSHFTDSRRDDGEGPTPQLLKLQQRVKEDESQVSKKLQEKDKKDSKKSRKTESKERSTKASKATKFANDGTEDVSGSGEDGEGQGQDDEVQVVAEGDSGMGDLVSGSDDDLEGWGPCFPSPKHGGLRRRSFLMLEDPHLSVLGKFMAAFIVLTVTVSTITFVMESIPEFRERPAECAERLQKGLPPTIEDCEPQPDKTFYAIEVVCILIFTVEYLARMVLAHSDRPPNVSGWLYTLRYSKTPMNIVDLLAILPFYVDLVAGGGSAGFLRVLRLARILRLFKMAKHHPGVKMFTEVMIMSGQPLLLLLFFNVIIVVLFGSLVFFAENESFSVAPEFTDTQNGTVAAAYPKGVYIRGSQDFESDEATPFRSIPYGLWWVCVTMTTVGYGDMSPTTRLGKALGISCFYVGIIFLALPIGVLSTNFELVYAKYNSKQRETKKTFRKTFAPKQDKARQTEVGYVHPWIPSMKSFGVRRAMFLMFEDPLSSRVSHWLSILMTVTILSSTLSFICESMPRFQFVSDDCNLAHLSVDDCQPRPDPFFYQLEIACIVIFTTDYVIRIATAHSALPNECGLEETIQGYQPLKQTLRYATHPLNVIDFLAIVPFYGDLIAGGGGGGIPVLRVLRLIRVFRLLKAPKLRVCSDMFANVILDAAPALLTLIFLTTLTCIFFAAVIHFAEGSEYSVDSEFLADHPKGLYIRPSLDGYSMEQSPYRSILYAFWWFFVTATTVGFGDDYPTSTFGRCVGICTFYLGIILLALPLSIVGGSFNKFYPDWVKEFAPLSERESCQEMLLQRSSTLEACMDRKQEERADRLRTVQEARGDAPTQPVVDSMDEVTIPPEQALPPGQVEEAKQPKQVAWSE